MVFSPTVKQIRLAEAMFAAMAHEQIIRPIVEQYETAILAKHQWRIARKWLDRSWGFEDRVILDRKETCLLEDQDASVFYQECFAARDAAGLRVEKPDNCPLCEAEHLRIQCETALLQAMGDTPGLESFSARGWSLDMRERALDLLAKLLAPYCGNADEILCRISIAPCAD